MENDNGNNENRAAPGFVAPTGNIANIGTHYHPQNVPLGFFFEVFLNDTCVGNLHFDFVPNLDHSLIFRIETYLYAGSFYHVLEPKRTYVRIPNVKRDFKVGAKISTPLACVPFGQLLVLEETAFIAGYNCVIGHNWKSVASVSLESVNLLRQIALSFGENGQVYKFDNFQMRYPN